LGDAAIRLENSADSVSFITNK
jgi:hypothetical protein